VPSVATLEAMLARAAHFLAKREVSRETLRREFYRCSRESAAKGDSPQGGQLMAEGCSESGDRA